MTTATTRQVAYATTLIDAKVWPEHWTTTPAEARERLATSTKRQVSSLIDTLRSQPWQPREEAAEPATEGYYVMDDSVYRVRTSKAGRNYALRLVISQTADGKRKGTWDYAKGVVYRLASAERLTVEQAAARGHLDGVCVICGKALTDPASVERGIGPVCVTRI